MIIKTLVIIYIIVLLLMTLVLYFVEKGNEDAKVEGLLGKDPEIDKLIRNYKHLKRRHNELLQPRDEIDL